MAQAQTAPVHFQRSGGLGQLPTYRALETIGYALFGLFVFLIGFAMVEPSPYDFMAILVILFWLAMGARVPRSSVLFLAVLLVYCLGILFAVIPLLHEPESVRWALISLHLAVTAVFFVMFFSDDSTRRMELALKAYLAGCLVNAVAGILGFFDILGTYHIFTDEERAKGLFKDPNVFGSFLILGVLYVSRDLLTGEGRRPLLGLAMLPVLLAGIFLAFSRGAWAAAAIATVILLATTFATSRSLRVRRRILWVSVLAGIVAAGSIVSLLTIQGVQTMFEERAQVAQPYDVGETGRFGQHARSIPALMERPNGYGPLRYRYYFRLDPHNAYVNSFASGGWISGFAYLLLILGTTWIGWRLAIRPSPYQRHGQILFAMHLTFVLQSFQIDLEHWRHIYLVWGAIWGLEAARLRWLAGQRYAAPFFDGGQHVAAMVR
jgi:hypothetical protein